MTPKPELTNKPANKAPKDKVPDKYNSVIKTLEAQFGIKPIIDVNRGAKYLLASMKLVKFSCPTQPINSPNPKLMTKT